MPIKDMTPEEIAAASAAVIAAAGKSTDTANRLPGETSAEANARITAAYKEMLAKPVLSQEAADAGAKVQFVRTGAGGQGEYTVVTPIGYDGPPITTTEWTKGIIPATGKYTSGTTLGVYSNGDGTYTKVGDVNPTSFTNPTGTVATPKKTSTVTSTQTSTTSSSGKTLTDVIGSSVTNFSKDPVTGKQRTPQEMIDAVKAAAIAAGIDPNLALAQFKSNAIRESGDLNLANIIVQTMGGKGNGIDVNGTGNGSGLDTATANVNKVARQSAYDTLYNEFSKYGLGSLVEDIKGMIQDVNVAPSQISIALQNTDAYKKRFSANQDRIKQGLRALTAAEYIGLEDQYQDIMRNYGLPASYWSKDSMGTQAGFNKFIANDVSAAELEDRIATAQKRVLNADVNVKDALRQFYPDITNADILAYTLDPTNALENIKRKVTAAEIGGAALAQGLGTSQANAEDLARYGITKAQAQQGYASIGEFLPTASQLGDIYAKQGIGPYTQATAEAEVFNTANAADAARKRKRLAQLEQAQFGGSSGTSGNALSRDRAMTNQMLGTPGAGSF